MSSNTNRFIATGNLTRDPETNHTASGTTVCNFTIANNLPVPNKEEKVSFFNCVTWGKTAETCGKYLKKGSKVCVDGHLEQSNYTAGDGSKRSVYQIQAERVEFLTPYREDA